MSARARLALLGAVVALRAVGLVFGPVDIDETDFHLFGRLLAHGGLPYVDIVEKKPIFTLLFYWPCALFGGHMWPVQVAAILWLYATCRILGKAARHWTGDPLAEPVGAALCLAISACNIPSVNAELLMNLPAAAMLYAFARSTDGRSRWDLLSGLAAAAATLFKHQAGVLLVAALVVAARRPRFGTRAGRLSRLLAGFTLPWLAVALVYASLGHLDAFVEWNVTRNLTYVATADHGALGRFALGVLVFGALAAPLPWWLVLTRRRPPGDVGALALVALWLAWIPVCLGGRFYGHYFLQFAPPLALLATPPLCELVRRLEPRRRRHIVAILVAPVIGFQLAAWGRGVAGRYPAQEPRTVELAGWLRAHTPNGARLFVWGHFTPIYYLAERLPGTRYSNTSVHMGDFDPHHLPRDFDAAQHASAHDVMLTLDDLERRRPEVVVDTSPADIHEWSKVPLTAFPALTRYIDDHYKLVAQPGGARVYFRISDPPVK
jgi:hypothetical protein